MGPRGVASRLEVAILWVAHNALQRLRRCGKFPLVCGLLGTFQGLSHYQGATLVLKVAQRAQWGKDQKGVRMDVGRKVEAAETYRGSSKGVRVKMGNVRSERREDRQGKG